MPLCFACTYFLQREVTDSFNIILYIEIEKDACGNLRLLTSFDLNKHGFADIGEPYDAKVPLLAHVKCSCGKWMLRMNVMIDAYDGCIHTYKNIGKAFSFGFALTNLWRVEILSPYTFYLASFSRTFGGSKF